MQERMLAQIFTRYGEAPEIRPQNAEPRPKTSQSDSCSRCNPQLGPKEPAQEEEPVCGIA